LAQAVRAAWGLASAIAHAQRCDAVNAAALKQGRRVHKRAARVSSWQLTE